MNLYRVFAVSLALIASGGCTTVESTSSSSILPLEGIAVGVLLFVVIDPLAPNWHIEQMRLGENRFRIAMRKKRFTTGGDGEAMPAFYRRAEQIASELGSERYRIVEFTEGIDSVVPVAQRVAQGIVEIIR